MFGHGTFVLGLFQPCVTKGNAQKIPIDQNTFLSSCVAGQVKSTHVSASTMRVFVTFSMVNLVFPPFPAILPMALDKWSPFRGFTAKTENTRGTIKQTEFGH